MCQSNKKGHGTKFSHGALITCDKLEFYPWHSLCQLWWNLEIPFRKRKERGVRLKVYVVIWFVHFLPKGAVNMLFTFWPTLFISVQLYLWLSLWHVLLHATVARWCCWRWYGCFKQDELAPVFAVSDALLPEKGLYRIRHHSNTLSAFGNRSQKFGSLWKGIGT